MMPTQARLKELLRYDEVTGKFYWRVSRGKAKAGGEAGNFNETRGRVIIGIDNGHYSRARLAWLYVHGEWPTLDVEHANTDPCDDRIANLRLATRSQNNGNVGPRARSKSGVKGVHWDKSRGKWCAMIQFNGRHKNLGRFDSIDCARNAYANAARELFGEFARLS